MTTSQRSKRIKDRSNSQFIVSSSHQLPNYLQLVAILVRCKSSISFIRSRKAQLIRTVILHLYDSIITATITGVVNQNMTTFRTQTEGMSILSSCQNYHSPKSSQYQQVINGFSNKNLASKHKNRQASSELRLSKKINSVSSPESKAGTRMNTNLNSN